jgi:hypothetical protein
MANELKNIQVQLISLVDKGANQKTIICKKWDAPSASKLNYTINIIKSDEEKRLVYGIVYSPNQIDAHGDFATADEIEKAMELFMKASNTNAIDTQHNLQIAENCFIRECWIVKENDAVFPDEIGAWAVCIKVDNEYVWEKVKSGEYTGLSMYGFANKVPVEESDNPITKFYNVCKNFFTMDNKSEKLIKDFNEELAKDKMFDFVWALQDAIYDILDDDTITDKPAAILESINQFNTTIASIQTAKSEVQKAGKVLSDANLTKIQTALDALQAVIASMESVAAKREKILKKLKPEDIEMTKDEIQKTVTEAVSEAVKKEVPTAVAEAVKIEIEKVKTGNETVIKELKEKIEKFEKTSNGSQQVTEPGTEIKKEKFKLNL